MNEIGRLRLWGKVVERACGASVSVAHVCAAMVSASGVDCAAVTVVLPATPRETIHVTGQLASELEELTLTVGEGPGVDAMAGGLALAGDLSTVDCLARWPLFAPAATRAGVRAVFALPLQIGAIRLGVLDLYRAQPGDLDREQLADALMLADTVCALLLDSADRDRLSTNEWEPLERAGPMHPVVHQATGMLVVQLGSTAAVALIRLRAYAYARDRRLHDVAGDVVAGRLRFDAAGE